MGHPIIDGRARRIGEAADNAIVPVARQHQRGNFVSADAPLVLPNPPIAEVEPPAGGPTSIIALKTTYLDRARGFQLEIAPVAAVVGIASCVAGVALFSVPILSWAALQVFVTAFCFTWAAGYALHKLVSPDGALWINVVLLWINVYAERRHRHQRYWTAYHDARRDAGKEE